MKQLSITFLYIFVLFFKINESSAQTNIIYTGDIWKYYDVGNINNPTWATLGFEDTLWPSGPSELGYGDGDENTTVGFGGNSSNKYITTYFRKKITLDAQYELKCKIKFDDATIVYLNNVEVFRNNLPQGLISYSTLASNNGAENVWAEFTIPANLTSSGENIFAIEIHQGLANSSDISFDFICEKLPLPPIPLEPGIYINEVMTDNETTLRSNVDKSSSWIEIYNNTNMPFNLGNCYISNDKNNLLKHKFANDTSLNLNAGVFKIIWASGITQNGPNHLNFDLSKNKSTLYLTASNGIDILDSLLIQPLQTDVSFGKHPNDKTNFLFFAPATPNSPNLLTDSYLGLLPKPKSDLQSGSYENGINLTLSHDSTNVTFRYSTNSFDPYNITKTYNYKNNYPQALGQSLGVLLNKTLSSNIYNGPISVSNINNNPNEFCLNNFGPFWSPFHPNFNIPKAQIIRSTAFKTNYKPSETATNTYFNWSGNISPFKFQLLSLSMNEYDLIEYVNGISVAGQSYDWGIGSNDPYFLSYGNYLKSGREWQRPGNIEIFNGNTLVSNNLVGVRLHGNSARYSIKKSFRIYFRNNQNIFPGIQAETFVVKNQTTTPKNEIAHIISQGISEDLQAIKPVTLFLNGEYWGNYSLLNHLDEKYLSKKYNLDETKMDIFKETSMSAGDPNNYTSFINYISQNNFTNQANYDSLSAKMDYLNFATYIAIGIYFNNTDWLAYNSYLWRNQSNTYFSKPSVPNDGRWRWITTDLDQTLKFPETNSVDYPLDGTQTGNVYAKLIQNQQFKILYLNRFADLLNTNFKSTESLPKFQTIRDNYASETLLDGLRWTNTDITSAVNSDMNAIEDFLTRRPNIQFNQLKSKFGIPQIHEITLALNSKEGYVKLNTIDVLKTTALDTITNNVWAGRYFENIPIKITAKAQSGYLFSYWLVNNQIVTDSSISINLTTNITYLAVFEKIILSINPIPTAFNLKSCSYKFTNWPSNSSINTYPLNIRFVYLDEIDPSLTSNIEGYTAGAYNATSRTRIVGLGQNGFGFINTTGSTINIGYPSGKLGGAILALNTLELDSIKISWKARTITPNSRKYALRLQYREGDLLPFQDFDPPIEYIGSPNVGDSLEFAPINLPIEIVNKPYIQLFWKYYFTGIGSSGARDLLAIDDIKFETKIISSGNINNIILTKENPNKIEALNQSIENNAIVNFNAQNWIILYPGFESKQGSVFKAEINTCEISN